MAFLPIKREDAFAAIGRLLQRLLRALARHDAALGIEIEEDVVPAVLGDTQSRTSTALSLLKLE